LIKRQIAETGLRHGQPRHQPFANSAAGDVAEEPHELGDAASLVGERRIDSDRFLDKRLPRTLPCCRDN
jgi:hypothetical protein